MGKETTTELSARARAGNLNRMRQGVFDLAVIGGGITGAGTALDAASRGLTVALIEKGDFASGTSSRSSKLIHGGLRYLKQLQFGLVREALAERATLSRLAPHLASPLAFLVPVYARGTPSPLGRSRLKLRLGLWLYDLLAGRSNVARHRWLTPEQARLLSPALEMRGLKGCFLYYDCLTNDARLVIEVIKAAAARGAVVANYAAARGFVKTGGRISGVEVEDALTGARFQLRARVVVSAAGVWSDEVYQLADKTESGRLRPSKGIHILVPSERLPGEAAVLIPVLGERRFLFVIPWRGRTLIGTTDTDYAGDIDEPLATTEEVSRILESVTRFFPGSDLASEDVISTFAGLRPLVGGRDGSTSGLSRKEDISEAESGLISIIGGKLTTYRRMAERAVDLVVHELERASGVRRPGAARSVTRKIALAGGALPEAREAKRASIEFGLPADTVGHLIRTYGGNYRAVLEVTREHDDLRSYLIEDLPHIEAEVIYAARSEMAVTVEDFLARRTPIALVARDHGRSCAMRVASLMGRELDWSSAQIQNALAGFVTRGL